MLQRAVSASGGGSGAIKREEKTITSGTSLSIKTENITVNFSVTANPIQSNAWIGGAWISVYEGVLNGQWSGYFNVTYTNNVLTVTHTNGNLFNMILFGDYEIQI